MDLTKYIRDIPDFPKKGIIFKDITPILASPEALDCILDGWVARYRNAGIQKVVGIESRGFLFGAPLADRLGVGFAPARKPGKLPYKTIRAEYALEYGTDAVEIHEDAISPVERTLLVDDLLATGGTAEAAIRLIEQLGGVLHECAFVVELAFLGARAGKLKGRPLHSLITY